MMDTKFEDMAITPIETSSQWSIRSVGTENTEISLGESKLGISNKSSIALSMEIPEDDSNMIDKQCIKTRESTEGTKTPLLTSSRWSKRIINSENKKSNIPLVKTITKAKSQIKGKSTTKENKKIPRTSKKASKVNLATKEKLTKEERDELIALWCPTLECVVCHKGFPRYKLLLAHFHEQHSNEKFVLTCCNLRFDTRARFEEHIRVHLNPEAFKCKRCSETFKWKISLTRHKCRVR